MTIDSVVMARRVSVGGFALFEDFSVEAGVKSERPSEGVHSTGTVKSVVASLTEELVRAIVAYEHVAAFGSDDIAD